ncbi:helix-turn-helix domain-containing protein [Sphingomonas echinoides]|uniref:AraC family transcriptional regulator n=1 Tax=Sphingomonas echinoides TaxID=59803 RepID=A0ABU4PJK0_9SPHN|nr:AraC family transcriptional regulator [Sphingomonas echinoides]MDX5984373.1 AraC family transcriptional regulator [Sphingomonas echinoides]
MNEPEFHTMLTTLNVAVQSFRDVTLRHGHALAGHRNDGIEVQYVLAGTLRLTIPRQADRLCGQGTLLLLPPGLERVITPADGVDGDRIGPELRIAMGVLTARVSGTFDLLGSVSDPIVSVLPEPLLIQQICGLMIGEAAEPGQGSRALVDALMKVCIVMALRDAVGRAEGDAGLFGALRDPRLGKAIVAVIENPAAPHTVSSLASAASMSRSAFAREFAAKLAMTPMAFVARARLQQGADLLNGTRLPVKMIASNIGFASRSHFSRAFSAAYGADPSSFRRMSAAVAPFPSYSNAGDRS